MHAVASSASWYDPDGQDVHEEGSPVHTDPAGQRSDPGENVVEGYMSEDVFIIIPWPCLEPIERPLMVIVNQLGGLIVVPKMVTNNSAMLLKPQVAVNPTKLLAPEVIIGVTDASKK